MDPKGLRLRCLSIASEAEAVSALRGVGADAQGIEAMLPKMIQCNILLEGVECRTANRLKEAMLALGGDAAISCDALGMRAARTDVLLIGTLKTLRRFAETIDGDAFGWAGYADRIREATGHFIADTSLLRTSRREIRIGERTLVMGIINTTPDSFSDGGRYFAPSVAVDAAIRMVEEGADMIDVGGESSRPGSDPVPEEEELRRVIPVIRGLAGRISAPLSIDTMKASVAREALAEGAEIVNDISAMTHDEGMAAVVAETHAAVILMHMRGLPKTMQTGDLAYQSLLGEVIAFLKSRIDSAVESGIAPEQVMIDPGIGFGKSAADNLRLIRRLSEFKVLGRPIVTGVSRKSFIGHVTGGGPQERLEGTAASVTAAILNGSRVVRVHDVEMMKKVAAMADALVGA